MLVLITYDVETKTPAGQRLRKVAKICTDYGQRVQNSVFELSVTPAQCALIKQKLDQTIEHETDSIRIYYLGKNWERRIETIGLNKDYNPDKGLLLL